MKRTLAILLALVLALGLLAGCGGGSASQPAASSSDSAPASSGSAPAAKKTMIIGDTTFNAENWEETIDPHRTYNGWPCIR